MSRYAAISEDISTSEDWADLVSADPKAAIVYAMCWPHVDVYGILPASPRRFIATVCPLLGLTPGKAEKIISILEERGHVVRYEAGGESLLWFPSWSKRNTVRWDKIASKPTHPLPPQWIPPDDLVRLLQRTEKSVPLREWFGEDGRLLENPAHSGNLPEVPVRSGLARAGAGAFCSSALALADASDSEGEGEGNGEGEPRPTYRGDTDHLHGVESGAWQTVIAEVCPSLPRTGNGYCNRREWGLELARCDADENYPYHGDDLVAVLRASNISVRTKPREFLGMLERKYHAQQGERRRVGGRGVAPVTIEEPETNEYGEVVRHV